MRLLFVFVVMVFLVFQDQWRLSWDPNTEEDMLRYNVFRAEITYFMDADFIYIGSVQHPDTNYIDSDVSYDNEYAYYLTAQDSAYNESDPSDTVNTIGILLLNDLDREFKYDVSAFPNPTKGGITFKMRGAFIKRVEFRLYDVTGRLIDAEDKLVYRYGEYIIRKDYSDLSPGMYMYRLNGSYGKLVLIK